MIDVLSAADDIVARAAAGRRARQLVTLGVDPGSQRIGWAFLHGDDVHEAGVITPPPELIRERKRASRVSRAAGRPLRGRGLPALERLVPMIGELLTLVEQQRPDRVAIEIPSATALAHRGRNQAGYGLTTLGVAAGAIWSALLTHLPVGTPITAFDEREWTRGRQKTRRARALAMSEPRYQAAADPGLDAADAIQIARHGIGAFREEART